jgi:hypothetical protein
MATRTPPRYVPTLTEVVKPAADAQPAPDAAALQEELVRRVLQRVDLSLERRLREAIAATLLEQTRSIVPLLRDEIEAVVRETVANAFADEVDASRRR